MILKKVNAWLHLWLGLASGIIVFVVAITGCILVFEQEIKSMTQPWLHVTRPAGSPYLPPSVIHGKMADRFPGKKIYSVWYYGHERSAQVSMNADSVVYVNPYTADVVAITEDEDFFHFILEGHTELWIEGKVGQNIVLGGYANIFYTAHYRYHSMVAQKMEQKQPRQELQSKMESEVQKGEL
jgi:uncharacterized iron-regulated membrane protein